VLGKICIREALMLAFHQALPANLKVRKQYADDRGVLADLGLSQEWPPADA
jgi:hypothetical protein